MNQFPLEDVFTNGYKPFFYYPAPCQVRKFFKDGLLEIGGKLPNGQRRLRVGWGMDIRWQRGGKNVPRYVKSAMPRRVEKVQESGVVTVEQPMQYFGTPQFIVEEWHDRFVPEGSGIDPEKDWEEHRYECFYERWGEPLAPPKTFADYFFHLRQIGVQVTREEARVIVETYREGRQSELPGIPTREKVLLDHPIDRLGPFPRGGRYEYLCAIRPSGAPPTEQWLEVIRESYRRRQNRRFRSVDAEVADMVEQAEAERRKTEDKIRLGIEDNLRTHVHRLFTATPNKGGSGPSIVFLPGKEQ